MKQRLTQIIFLIVIAIIAFPKVLSSQVTTLQPWSNLLNGTGTLSTSYPVASGSNTYRLLVVAVATSTTADVTRTVTVTYGGQALTLAAGDLGTSTRQHTAMYYLREAGLDAAANTTLAVTVSGGTTRVNTVWAAVYDYIDQNTVFSSTAQYSSGTGTTSSPTFSPSLAVGANELAIGVLSSYNVEGTATATFTAAANWTLNNQQTWTTTNGVRNAVGTFNIPASNTTTPRLATLSLETRASMTAMSLVPADLTGYYFSNGTYTVPAGVTCITVKAWGAGGGGGGGGAARLGGNGGGGGYAESTINVTPGQQLTIRVGGNGNGGATGTGTDNSGSGGSGGGYSGVFTGTPSQANAIVVAAGGGGGGGGDNQTAAPNAGAGGAGGANTGATGGGGGGTVGGGGGGTLAAGGAAGNGDGTPTAGSALTGGNGGNLGTLTPGGTNGGGNGGGGSSSTGRPGGGGGGAGYFGGGGGGASNAANTSAGGGGGASSFASGETTSTLAGSGVNPANTGNVHYLGGFGVGGSGGAVATAGSAGGGGLVFILVNECPSFTYQKTDANCFGANNGQIIISASGGTPPYQYSINGGSSWQAGNTFSNLPPANYTIAVKDSKGCIQTECN